MVEHLLANLAFSNLAFTNLTFANLAFANLVFTNLASDDVAIVMIVLLLPLAASLLVFQQNPYYALVIRGILGAIAALIYALMGAADVALTEALVGTMLSVTLYAIAIRSSMTTGT